MKVVYFIAALVLCTAVCVRAKWTTIVPGPNVITDISPIKNADGDYSACIVGGYGSTSDPDKAIGLWCGTQPDLSDLTRLTHYESSAMQMALAISEKGPLATSGLGFLNYTTHLMYSLDGVTAYNSEASLYGISQDIKPINSNTPRTVDQQLFAAVGTLEGQNALFLSQDSGRSFMNRSVDSTITYGDARYVSGFTSSKSCDNILYVTIGTWPSSLTAAQEQKDIQNRCIRRSEKICTPAPRSYTAIDIQKANAHVYSPIKQAIAPFMSPNGGYVGIVVASSDGGQTWKRLIEVDDRYYNDIHCITPQQCLVVGENSNNAYAMYTNDGGVTWSTTLELHSSMLVSLFRCRWVTQDIGYVVGGLFDDDKQTLNGVIYKTSNGGKSWELDGSLPDVGIIMGLSFSFDGKVGYAVGSTQSNQAIVARWTPDA